MDGEHFYATSGQNLYLIDAEDQTEDLAGAMDYESVLGLEFAGNTLMGFEVIGDKLVPTDLETGEALGSPADLQLYDLGTIVFLPLEVEPDANPDQFD